MEIKLRKYRDIYILMLKGELDLYNATDLERMFLTLVNKGIDSFILDFEDIVYIDSSGVGILLKLNRIAKGKDLNFMLSGVNGEVLNVLTLSNLIKFFPVTDTYQKAVKKLLKQTDALSGEARIDKN
jgi:anti-sigma B factor antagonist